MGDPQLYMTVIQSFETVVVALIAGLFARDTLKRKARQLEIDKRSELRAEEGRLVINLLGALIDLGAATALAIKNNKINGELTNALEAAKGAQGEYQDFLTKTAQQIKHEV